MKITRNARWPGNFSRTNAAEAVFTQAPRRERPTSGFGKTAGTNRLATLRGKASGGDAGEVAGLDGTLRHVMTIIK